MAFDDDVMNVKVIVHLCLTIYFHLMIPDIIVLPLPAEIVYP